jgi:hypothetical protein
MNLLYRGPERRKPALSDSLLTRESPPQEPKLGLWARLKKFLKGGKENVDSKDA